MMPCLSLQNAISSLELSVSTDRLPLNSARGVLYISPSAKNATHKQIIESLVEQDLPVLNAKLPASVKMKESHMLAKPLVQMAAKHKLTEAFNQLFDEINQ